jgi:hypothetical protein
MIVLRGLGLSNALWQNAQDYHTPRSNPHERLASASGVYNSSQTPSTLPWNTYNFCNAPHVNAAHYELPPNTTFTSNGGSQLIHVSVIIRHHKVRAFLFFLFNYFVYLASKRSARRTTPPHPSATSTLQQGGFAPTRLYNSRMISAARQSRTTPRRPTTTHSHLRSGLDRAMSGSSLLVDSLMPRSTERWVHPYALAFALR